MESASEVEAKPEKPEKPAKPAKPEKSKEPRDPLSLVLTLIAAAIVVSLSVVGYVLYDNMAAEPVRDVPVVKTEDTVILNYIGMFSDGRVFDTSMISVADNDASYPKSLTFTRRENDSYVPLEMTAGLYGVSGGTIKGFALGVIGMKEGETKIVEVLPEDGYAVNPDMLETIDVVQEVPATETMTDDEFSQLFSADAIPMDTVNHYLWGWPVLVVSNSGGVVTLKSMPEVGYVCYPYGDPEGDIAEGWECTVLSYDPEADGGIGIIQVRNDISADDVYNTEGTGADGLTFVVSDFNSTAGTFQIHKSDPTVGYNGEISGRTLYFEITVLVVKSD